MTHIQRWTFLLLIGGLLAGCAGEWGSGATGAALGAVGTAGGYELAAHHQMERLNRDLKDGKITQQEYEIRKSQIERGSMLY